MFDDLVVLRVKYFDSLFDRLLVVIRPLGHSGASEKSLLQGVVLYIEEEN